MGYDVPPPNFGIDTERRWRKQGELWEVIRANECQDGWCHVPARKLSQITGFSTGSISYYLNQLQFEKKLIRKRGERGLRILKTQ